MNNILQGHVLDVLRTLPADSVDCVVTSPPYWGLRDYKIEPQIWDAEEGCEHEWGEDVIKEKNTWGVPNSGGTATGKMSTKGTDNFAVVSESKSNFCLRCGAWRGSLGLEPTPELYVRHITQVFREVRRVLKPTGVCFVNLGDSYAANRSYQVTDNKWVDVGNTKSSQVPDGLKPKDLCGIPWRVAFALQGDGWWLRSDIIWSKPNPMPESVTDRPTKAHEYIFLLTKSAKYFWNQESVREKAEWARWGQQTIGKEYRGIKPVDMDTLEERRENGRNIRSVWTFATEPTPEAHFATFPQELVKRCILAGCPDNGTVLDPFMGSGTTGIVAENLYRKWIGIELNPEYIKIAEKRLRTKANIDQVNWIKNETNMA